MLFTISTFLLKSISASYICICGKNWINLDTFRLYKVYNNIFYFDYTWITDYLLWSVLLSSIKKIIKFIMKMWFLCGCMDNSPFLCFWTSQKQWCKSLSVFKYEMHNRIDETIKISSIRHEKLHYFVLKEPYILIVAKFKYSQFTWLFPFKIHIILNVKIVFIFANFNLQ